MITLVIERATNLDERALASRARKYLEAHKFIKVERGGVPLGVAATLGYLYSKLDPQWLWPVDQQDAARLKVGPGVKPRIVFWAGLRTVNEVAKEIAEEQFSELTDHEFWVLVCQAYSLSTPVTLRLHRVASRSSIANQDELTKLFKETDPQKVAEACKPFSLLEATYRMLSAEVKVRAGEAISGEDLGQSYQLREAPDARIGGHIRQGLRAIYIVGGVGLVHHLYRHRLP